MKRRSPKSQPEPVGAAVRITLEFVTTRTADIHAAMKQVGDGLRLSLAGGYRYRVAELRATQITTKTAAKYGLGEAKSNQLPRDA